MSYEIEKIANGWLLTSMTINAKTIILFFEHKRDLLDSIQTLSFKRLYDAIINDLDEHIDSFRDKRNVLIIDGILEARALIKKTFKNLGLTRLVENV